MISKSKHLEESDVLTFTSNDINGFDDGGLEE